MELAPIFKKAYWSLAFAGLLYVLGILSLTFPTVQRSALYMHKINPSKFQDVNDVESFGFLRSQVQPFNIVTPDNETLYAWHVLPLHLCEDYDRDITADSPSGPAKDVTQTPAFKQLAENRNASVVVNLHGNAADVGTGYRPRIYRNMVSISTPSNPVHLITFDYRGFGQSTGTPTEEGLITDAETVINFLTSPPLSIPHSRIAVTGQSLGTAVAAAVAERFAFGKETGLQDGSVKPSASPEPFAGVFLFAPFRNLSDLLDSYSFFGIFPPLFSPLMAYPRVKDYVVRHIADKWDTASRLARLVGANPTGSGQDSLIQGPQNVDITVVHAVNDFDIPWREGRRTWEAAVGGISAAESGTFVVNSTSQDGATELMVWERSGPGGKGVKRATWYRMKYGGHNEIASLPGASLAVKRAFERRAEQA